MQIVRVHQGKFAEIRGCNAKTQKLLATHMVISLLKCECEHPLPGFLDGWASDEKCLARHQTVIGSFLPAGNVKHYVDPSALKEAIVNEEVIQYYLATYVDCI